MITLSFEPGSIKAMQTSFTKEGYVEVLSGHSTQSNLLDDCLTQDVDLMDLTEFFVEVRKEFGSKEDYYIILPDSVFLTIDIFMWEKDGDIAQKIRQKTGRNLNDLYYSCPIVCTPKGQPKKTTACVIEKYIIDNIAKAASEAQLRLVSIEASSIAFFRTKENLSAETMILESYHDFATIIAYSGVAGAFSMDCPDLASKRLDIAHNPDDANFRIYSAITNMDQIAYESFSQILNEDVPYTLISDQPKIAHLDSFSVRAAKSINWPDVVAVTSIDGKVERWLPLLGTVLQNAPQKDLLWKRKPPFLSFLSGNLLPADAIKQAKALQIKDRTVQGIKYAIAGLFCVLVAELGMFLYFSSIEIPKDLQADYKAAYESSGDINHEMALITTANKEDAGAIKGFSELLKSRPQDIGFVKIEISNNPQPNSSWITLTAAAAEPIKFQDYLASLSMNPVFANPSISKISSDSNGVKVAEFTAQRGGGQQ